VDLGAAHADRLRRAAVVPVTGWTVRFAWPWLEVRRGGITTRFLAALVAELWNLGVWTAKARYRWRWALALAWGALVVLTARHLPPWGLDQDSVPGYGR
jgi:hypothetical protein